MQSVAGLFVRSLGMGGGGGGYIRVAEGRKGLLLLQYFSISLYGRVVLEVFFVVCCSGMS